VSTDTAYQRILDALTREGLIVRPRGDRKASAQCPAHDDRNPSLSVTAIEGQALLYCQAGCPTADVLAALHLTMRDLFDESSGVRYHYADSAGTVLRTVTRSPDKRFWQSGQTQGGTTLYRLPGLAQAVARGDSVYLVEGEKDVHALESLGAVATTAPMGASNFRKVDPSPLREAHVVAVVDRDDAGGRWAADVRDHLHDIAGDLQFVQAAEGKDAADHVAAGMGLEDFTSFLIPSSAPRDTGQASSRVERPEGPSKASVATVLAELAFDRYDFGQTTSGEPFATPRDGARVVRMLRGGSDSLRAEFADAYFSEHRKTAPQQALADALMVCEGRARTTDPQHVALRVAGTPDALWLDLGDDTGDAVRITHDGWRVASDGPLFRRTALTAALPTPTRDGTWEALWTLLNVAMADRPVVAAVLVASLFPDIPHPVVALVGEQGTGKSTATRVLGGILDPSPAPLRKAPKDVESWTTAAAGSWVVAVDNLSGLPDWFSDALCRASTGDGDVRRRLYSDGDLHVVAFRRCVVLNGIDLGAVRDDLADRLVTVQLERIPATGRRYDAELAQAWTEAHPGILGAVLDLACNVLARLDDVHLPDPPRMADFARVLAAVDEMLGTEGLARYRALAGDLAVDAVSSDPVLTALTDAIRAPWTGTAAELLEAITPRLDGWRAGRDWPKNARALTGLLRRRAPSLRKVGWAFDDLGRGGKDSVVRFYVAPPKAGDEAGDRRATSDQAGDAPAVARLEAPRLTCEDGEKAGEAGDTGDKPHSSLCLSWEEEKGRAPRKDVPDSSPATPVSPAKAPMAVPDTRHADDTWWLLEPPTLEDWRDGTEAA